MTPVSWVVLGISIGILLTAGVAWYQTNLIKQEVRHLRDTLNSWQDEAAIFRINRLLMAEIEGWSVEEGAGFLAIYLPNGWEVEQLSGTRAGSVFSANWSARAPRFWIFAPAS